MPAPVGPIPAPPPGLPNPVCPPGARGTRRRVLAATIVSRGPCAGPATTQDRDMHNHGPAHGSPRRRQRRL
jgi:hypothetical protein